MSGHVERLGPAIVVEIIRTEILGGTPARLRDETPYVSQRISVPAIGVLTEAASGFDRATAGPFETEMTARPSASPSARTCMGSALIVGFRSPKRYGSGCPSRQSSVG
jgi:hypothetical protein